MTDTALKARELRARETEDLVQVLNKQRHALHRAKFDLALGQLPKVHKLGQLRRDIARIKTVISERAKEK